MTQEIKLGQTLRDVVTGFQGVAVNKTVFLNGNIQYNLQQPVKEDGSYPEALSIDHHTLDVVDEGVSARAGKATYESPIKLGNEVECILSGLKGIASMKSYYLNGCAGFLVVSKLDKTTADGKTHAEDWIDQTRLKVVSKGIVEQVVQPPKAEDTGKRPGGPVMRGLPRC